MNKGVLYLIPVPLGDTVGPEKVIPAYNVEVINSLRHFVVEEGKTARRFLKAMGFATPLQECAYYELSEHTGPMDLPELLLPLLEGHSVGLMSEAGCPGVADPGSDLVKLAHQKGIKVVPLIGPSSILLALMASGFNGQYFTFNGYLPKDKAGRVKRLKACEQDAVRFRQTHLFIETPYRNQAFLEDCIQHLQADTLLLVASQITLPDEWIAVKKVSEWRKMAIPDMAKKPCIFGIYTS